MADQVLKYPLGDDLVAFLRGMNEVDIALALVQLFETVNDADVVQVGQ